jgi:TonB family protein
MNTTILEPQHRTTRLDVGLVSNSGGPDPNAWKRAIGDKKIPARLGMLDEEKPRWDVMGASALGQAIFFLFLLVLPLFFPERLRTALRYEVTPLTTPLTTVPVAPEPPKIKPKVRPVPKPEITPEPPKMVRVIKPTLFQPVVVRKPKPIEERTLELKPVFQEVKVETPSNAPKRPREEVKVGNMSTGSAAPATVNLPPSKVQTGGFGDENGIPGPGNPNKRANINAKGSVLLPGGPGYGNGTGGATGVRGTVVSTGFGNGTAVPPAAKRGGAVQQATGFGDASAAVAEAPKKKAAAAESDTTPVNILEKPHPQYTAEGRTLRIEGDVVIDVVFLSNGQMQVKRVVSGLGHGLDESASRAAMQIKFKPAKRGGEPVDFPARVRIEFRLAY